MLMLAAITKVTKAGSRPSRPRQREIAGNQLCGIDAAQAGGEVIAGAGVVAALKERAAHCLAVWRALGAEDGIVALGDVVEDRGAAAAVVNVIEELGAVHADAAAVGLDHEGQDARECRRRG